MGASHNWRSPWLDARDGLRHRFALLAAVASAVLFVPAASAAASEGEVEVVKTGPGAATSTVTSQPAGINCGTECTHEFGYLTSITLAASPGAGYLLGGWTVTPERGTCPNGSTAPTCEISTGFLPSIRVEADFVVKPPPPRVATEGTSEIDSNGATVEGLVNPNGSEANECYFEYGKTTAYGQMAPCSPSPGAGLSNVKVHALLTGLNAKTTYHYRLVASGLGGASNGEDHSVITEATAPQLNTERPEYSQTVVHLRGLINPENSPTTYIFRFGTSATYGQSIPTFPESAGGPGGVSVAITQLITGLAPGTTYHYRLVATNRQGTTIGPDQTFTTLTPLPDERAYELVTPPFKGSNGVQLGPYEIVNGGTNVAAISTTGSPLLVESLPLLGAAGADEEGDPTSYELARGASGWTTTSLTPAVSTFPTSSEQLASPADAAVGLWSAATPSDSIFAEDFYRREADGTFVNVGPIAPSSATAGPERGFAPTPALNKGLDGIVGASASLADVVYQIDSPSREAHSYLWPSDETAFGERPTLYEYVGTSHHGDGGDIPMLVGVDNSGNQISQCGTGLGGDTAHEAHAVHNGVSASGMTAFFTAQAGGCEAELGTGSGPSVNGLYARLGVPGGAQTTVDVAGTSECATSTSCNVTSPVVFQGASSDGAKVFFTTEQALLPSDQDTSSDIYECELPGDEGVTPTPAGVLNACPDLKAVSVTGTSSGANVQSVVALSDEGSRVYFTAAGVLTSEPDLSLSSGHQVATEGEDNLYAWQAPSAEHPAGHIAFIATLPEARPDEAQATPNGRYLVFTTTADLTQDDKSTVAQAFRYDAQTGELVRVSVGQNGFNNDGNTYSNPATLASTALGRLTVSDDGSYVVFQSSDALTPLVQGGLANVYEWHDGEVYLISDGVDTNQRAGLIGIDASGENIFFTTAEELVAQDTDEDVDIYDARINGGFPEPIPAPSCSGEACQGPLSAPLVPSAVASTSPPAIGNALPPGSKPTTRPGPKPLTNAQKLTKALQGCRKDKLRAKRQLCEKRAKQQYRPGAKKKGAKR